MDTLAFPTITLSSKFYPMLWPSHLDLDTDSNGQKVENHLLKMMEISTARCVPLNFLQPWRQMEKFFLLEARTVLGVMSPIQYWCKMAVTNVDACPHGSLLVGLADQQGDQIFLELSEENQVMGN